LQNPVLTWKFCMLNYKRRLAWLMYLNYLSKFQIKCIENPSFYQRYRILKHELERKLASTNFATETKLFHGTSEANVQAICTSGFNRSLAGTNGHSCSNGNMTSYKVIRIEFIGIIYGSGFPMPGLDGSILHQFDRNEGCALVRQASRSLVRFCCWQYSQPAHFRGLFRKPCVFGVCDHGGMMFLTVRFRNLRTMCLFVIVFLSEFNMKFVDLPIKFCIFFIDSRTTLLSFFAYKYLVSCVFKTIVSANFLVWEWK